MFIQSLQNALDFGVEVKHKVDIANNVIFYPGPSPKGSPVYIVSTYGVTQEGGRKAIEVELMPSLETAGALYTEHAVNIHGSSTHIVGMDQCGSDNKAGIATTLSNVPTDPIDTSGNPVITGSPAKQYNTANLSLADLINHYKGMADFTYDYASSQTLSGMSDQWGTPSASDTTTPIAYNGPMKIVYANMHGNTLTLSGGSHGAGILLVDGNVDLHGGFTWYGVIIATKAVDYTGGGQKNITGAVMCAETATVQVDIGGNAGILYCSTAMNKIKNIISPFRITRWREVY